MLHVAPLGFLSFSTGGYVPAGAIWLDGSAYFSRTPSSTGTPKTQTFSFWVKKTISNAPTTNNCVFSSSVDFSNYSWLNLDGAGSGLPQFQVQIGGANKTDLRPSAIDRDFTAWVHWVIVFDHTNVTSGNRCRVYKNGVRVTAFNTETYPATTDTPQWSTSGTAEYVGQIFSTHYFRGYMSEFIRLDGYAGTSDDFGEFDTNGNWVPIDPSGLTFGTNGFWLDFADSADLGNDVSGNGNDFTPTSITSANATNDNPADDAENGFGNYCTLNPLNDQGGATSAVLSEGNTRWYRPNDGSNNQQCYGTFGADAGKFYFEFKVITSNNGCDVLWLAPGEISGNEGAGPAGYDVATGAGIACGSAGVHKIWIAEVGSSVIATSHTLAANDVLKLAIDFDAGKIWCGSVTDDVWWSSAAADISFSESTPTFTFTPNTYLIPYIFGHAQENDYKFYFSESEWSGTPPTGFKSLHTGNLPAPTVTDPSAYFQTVLYTQSGTESRNITGLNFAPGLAIGKRRTGGGQHWSVGDIVRGTPYLSTNSTGAENWDGGTTPWSTWNSDGVSLNGNAKFLTDSAGDYVLYLLAAGGTGSANTDGTITSTVSVAAHGGFSIGTYTGTGANATVGHGLSSNPDFFIIKCTDQAYSWACWHKDLATGDYVLRLDSTGAQSDQGGLAWQSNPIATSGVITLGSQTGQNSVDAHVFYAFARTPGLIGIGSYVGNGSTDGPYVVVDDGGSGFRPAFVMVKRIDAVEGWSLLDAARDPYNPTVNQLQPNTTNAESGSGYWDFTANGFKAISTAGAINTSGGTYIYLAFAEYPFGGDGVAQAKAR